MNKKIIILIGSVVAMFAITFMAVNKRRDSFQPSPIKKLEFEDIKTGTGEIAMIGKLVKIHYTASIYGGKQFDNTYDRKPLEFRLGNGQTIAGFEQGIPGMKVGGIRKITMPPDMGFGTFGTGGTIPLNSALVYEVKLLESK